MKVLFAMFQGGGNIPLIAPIVAAVAGRRHETRVLLGPGIRRNRLPVSEGLIRRVESAGATRVAFDLPAQHPWDNLPSARGVIGSWKPRRIAGASEAAFINLWAPA